MTRSFAARAAVVAAAASAATAGASDWTVTGFASQRLEANDGDNSDTLRSVSDLGVNAVATTPRARVALAPGLRVTATNGDEDVEALPRLNARGLIFGERTTLSATASLLPQFVDDAQFEEDGGAEDAEGVQLTGTLGLSLEHALNRTDRVSLGADARATTFVSGDDLDDTRRFGLNAGFSRQLTPLTSASLTPAVSFFSGGEGGGGYTVSARAGVQTTPTPRHRVSFSLGPSATARDDDSGLTPGVVGGASLGYEGRLTSLSASFNQTVDNSATRGIDTVSAFSGGVSHRLTSRSRLSLNASASIRTPIDGDGDSRVTFSVSPSYAVDLTDAWTLSAGYQLRGVDGGGGDGSDDDDPLRNSVFLTLSRNLSLLP